MSCIEGVCYVRQPGSRPKHGRAPAPRPRFPAGVALAPAAMTGDAPGEASCPASGACGGCGPSCGCGPCREAHGHDHAPSSGIPMPPRTQMARRPRLVLAPAGAVDSVRAWADLSPEERRDLYGVAIDRAMDATRGFRPAGDPPANPTNVDALPDWARDRGVTQTMWTGMNAEAREAERQRWVAASGRGWDTANTIITQGTAIVNQVLRGDMERDLERIRQQGALGAAERRAAADEFVARTNLQIAQLRAAEAANPAQTEQISRTIAALTAAQSEAQGRQSTDLAAVLRELRQPPPPPPSNTTPLIIGAGVLGAFGLAAAMLLKR